jgi:ABC-type transport system involved in multi-copper enzyme maturation permease subunit
MTWLALRLLRPYLMVTAAVAAAATAYTFHGASVVQRQLNEAGVPDCLDPNVCYPHGAALNAVLGMELVAAFVPALLGLILGVALFAREREEDTVAFVLTQSISRRRWVLTKFGWALAAGLASSASVALAHRLVATRYTVLASDTYELLQLLHLNNIAYMVAQTAVVIVLGGVLGLSTGRTLRTLVLSVVGGPFVFMIVAGVAVALSYPLVLLTGGPDTALDGGAGGFTDDLYTLDPLAYLVSAVAALGVLAAVLMAPRVGVREPR